MGFLWRKFYSQGTPSPRKGLFLVPTKLSGWYIQKLSKYDIYFETMDMLEQKLERHVWGCFNCSSCTEQGFEFDSIVAPSNSLILCFANSRRHIKYPSLKAFRAFKAHHQNFLNCSWEQLRSQCTYFNKASQGLYVTTTFWMNSENSSKAALCKSHCNYNMQVWCNYGNHPDQICILQEGMLLEDKSQLSKDYL